MERVEKNPESEMGKESEGQFTYDVCRFGDLMVIS